MSDHHCKKFWNTFLATVSLAGMVLAATPEAPQNPVAISYQLQTPTHGVRLTGGVLKQTFNNNVQYLLNNFSADDLLFVYRRRAGEANPSGKPFNWDVGAKGPEVPGSVAGLFLMGSGNALRWQEDRQLRERLNAVVAGLSELKRPDGFIMAYPEDKTTSHENANYVRSWVTHGLIDASLAGNSQALPLIRGYLDWFNHCKYLPQVADKIRGYVPDRYLPYQGMISSSRMYLSPLGRLEDLNVILNYYQEDWWLDQLEANDDRAIYDRPETHCYEITALEAYLDLYRITGNVRYLQAVLHAWTMLHDKWEMPGGSLALCEAGRYPPKSYRLGSRSRSGELCCTVFWIKLNQRLHLLFPEQEAFASEIEKSIYSGIGHQLGSSMISYATVLEGKKDLPVCPPVGTCCEGQGTRLFGSLPEYLYSLAPQGIYVDLYAPSEITWKQGNTQVGLTSITVFPQSGKVELQVEAPKPVVFTLSLRIPSWVVKAVEVSVNGKSAGAGIPGTYHHLEREWKAGDRVSFTLPMGLRMNRYEGYDQIAGFSRYYLEYGPLLMAMVGKPNVQHSIRILNDPSRPGAWLKPVDGKPLHFQISTDEGYWRLREDEAWSPKMLEYVPYYEIAGDQEFTAFPVVQNPH